MYCVTVALNNDRASRSASSRQRACPFYSSRASFFGKASHQPGLSALLQPRLGSLRLLAFPKSKIAVEREEICECDGHTVHKLSQRRLTAEWLAPQGSDCLWMHSKVFSDWLPSYIKATRSVLEIFKMVGYFPDSLCRCADMHIEHCEAHRVYCGFHVVHCVIKMRASLIYWDKGTILQTEKCRTAFGFLLSCFSDWSLAKATREVGQTPCKDSMFTLFYFLIRPTCIEFKNTYSAHRFWRHL